MRLQTAMATHARSPGFVPFGKWRGFRSAVRDMGEEGPMRFVDGELVEMFLDLKADVQAAVVKELGEEGVNVEGVKEMVESLRRVH